MQDEMKRLREELREKHDAELSALRLNLQRETEEERSRLEKELQKLTSLQTALDSDESKIFFRRLLWFSLGSRAPSRGSPLASDMACLCLLGPQVLAVRQRLEAQYDGELQREKSCMATEIKELTALLQEQGEELLCRAQER